MSKELIEAALLGHTAGFIMGAGIMYLLLRSMKKMFLNPYKPIFTPEEMHEWVIRNKEIRELSRITRSSLDKLSGNV